MKLDKMNLPDELAQKLHKVEKRWLGVESTSTSLMSLSIFLCSLVIMYLSDRLWDTAPAVRLILLSVTFVSFISYVVVHLKKRKAYKDSPYKIIDLVQKHFPQLGDSLQGAVELSDESTRPDNISPELCRAAVAQVANGTSELDFSASVHTDRRNKHSRLFGLAVLMIIVFSSIDNQALFSSLERWINPFSQTERYTFVQLNDLPEEIIVLHGEAFELEISLKPESKMKPDEISWNFLDLPEQRASLSNGKTTLQFPGQTAETELHVFSFDCVRKVKIIPVHRPAITELQAHVKMPAYLQHKDLALELSGNSLELIQGSELTIKGVSSNALDSVGIYQPTSKQVAEVMKAPVEERRQLLRKIFNKYESSGKSLTGSVSGDKFRSRAIKVENEDKFYITWQDEYGFKEKEPYSLQVQTVEDEAPQVEFENVSRAFALLVSENIPLPMNATDNFGVKYLKIQYEVQSPTNENFSKTFNHVIKEGGPDQRSVSGEFIFAPSQLDVPEGSVVKVRALTNDYLPGRKDSTSADYKIFVLSKEEHAKLNTGSL